MSGPGHASLRSQRAHCAARQSTRQHRQQTTPADTRPSQWPFNGTAMGMAVCLSVPRGPAGRGRPWAASPYRYSPPSLKPATGDRDRDVWLARPRSSRRRCLCRGRALVRGLVPGPSGGQDGARGQLGPGRGLGVAVSSLPLLEPWAEPSGSQRSAQRSTVHNTAARRRRPSAQSMNRGVFVYPPMSVLRSRNSRRPVGRQPTTVDATASGPTK